MYSHSTLIGLASTLVESQAIRYFKSKLSICTYIEKGWKFSNEEIYRKLKLLSQLLDILKTYFNSINLNAYLNQFTIKIEYLYDEKLTTKISNILR